jgi:hypothetical protein
LVPPPPPPTVEEEEEESSSSSTHINPVQAETAQPPPPQEEVEPPVNSAMTDPNFGPYQLQSLQQGRGLRQRHRSSLTDIRQSVATSSRRWMQAIPVPRSTPEMRRLHIWFCLSRLIATPALVTAIIVALDCGQVLGQVPDLAKLVVILNSALPGALIVVVQVKGGIGLDGRCHGKGIPTILLAFYCHNCGMDVGWFVDFLARRKWIVRL